jgi:hypothetical protein
MGVTGLRAVTTSKPLDTARRYRAFESPLPARTGSARAGGSAAEGDRDRPPVSIWRAVPVRAAREGKVAEVDHPLWTVRKPRPPSWPPGSPPPGIGLDLAAGMLRMPRNCVWLHGQAIEKEHEDAPDAGPSS